MSTTPNEPTNLVLEQLRLMRGAIDAMREAFDARFDAVDADFRDVRQKIASIERELRGMKLNTIAEVYKANLTVASFVDHEHRITELERKSS